MRERGLLADPMVPPELAGSSRAGVVAVVPGRFALGGLPSVLPQAGVSASPPSKLWRVTYPRLSFHRLWGENRKEKCARVPWVPRRPMGSWGA